MDLGSLIDGYILTFDFILKSTITLVKIIPTEFKKYNINTSVNKQKLIVIYYKLITFTLFNILED